MTQLVITDSVINGLIRKQALWVEFPFLKFAATNLAKAPSCSKCGKGKDKSQRLKTYQNVKLSIASMTKPRQLVFKRLLNIDRVKVFTPSGRGVRCIEF